MTDRTVVYRLQADARQLKTEMAAASTSVRNAGVEMDGTTKKGQKFSRGLDVLGVSAGAVALGGIAAIVSKSADFDQAMANVQASTQETTANMAALRQAAMEAGAGTAFSATEAAAGIENLSKAGISTADILNGGLAGALDLAAAGQLDVGQAAEIAATALTQFKLEGEDVPHVADLLAAGAGKAQGEVTDLGQALNQAGLVAGQMGLSIEETTGTLSAFASAGLLGSDAGTAMKTMLLRLANPSKEAAKEMERFGISAYDAQGNMLPMADIAGQIQGAFKGQSQATRDAALATIFGSDAIRAANVLYSEGADGIAGWTDKVDDAGFAAEVAGDRMDSLRGDVELLVGSIETGMIGAGDSSQDSLRATTQAATGLVDILNELNATEPVQKAKDQLMLRGMSPQALELGVSNLRKVKEALFGVSEVQEDAADTADDKALSTRRAAEADQAHASAVRMSVAELEAQAKALQDARNEARQAASGFSNLGDALNDSTKSLGQWLAQMDNQADALNNFTNNSEKAADRGLRKGLIAALQDAGTEGALRMKQLANGTKDELDTANAAWDKNQKAIGRYVKSVTALPPAKIKVEDRMALASFREIDQMMSNLDGRVATTYVRTVKQGGLGPVEGYAAGSYVTTYGPSTLPAELATEGIAA